MPRLSPATATRRARGRFEFFDFRKIIKSLPQKTFNGMWSVVIVTTKGDCERAYRYPIAIAGTSVINAGNAAVDISGRVLGNGAGAVRVSAMGQSPHGSGR